MEPDTSFDAVATSFEDEIYGSSKGYVRLHVLWEDLLSEIPQLAHGGLSILDAGGGTGHMALRMGQLGNNVVLCDPSREMLSKAGESIRKANLSSKFAMIACHDALEWLASPKATLGHLIECLKYDGHLSLMFYNRIAALIKRIFSGAFAAALREQKEGYSPRGWGNGATPLAEEIIRGWLEIIREWLDEFGLRVRSKAGIRIFHDHLSDSARNREGLDSLLEVEKELREQEPFASLGQHILLVCEWTQ